MLTMGVSPQHFFFVGGLLLLLFQVGEPDLASDREALIAFRSSFARGKLPWNVTEASPCNWRGVTCNGTRVTELRLPGTGLVGPIRTGTIGNLTALQALSLRINRLTAPFPPDFSSLTELRKLYLNQNSFRGVIPSFIFDLKLLVVLSLADNEFTGPISPDFNKLTRLKSLYLENNNLNETIPDLKLSLTNFNVSNNNLNGSIPAALRKYPASAFLGNAGLCGGPLGLCPGETALSPAPASSPQSPNGNDGGKKKSKLSGGAIAGIAIGAVVGLCLLLLLLFLLCRKKDKKDKEIPPKVNGVPPESEVALRDKPVVTESGNASYGFTPAAAVAAVPAASAAAAGATGAANGNGKKLVFLGGTQRIYDLEDLLRASAEVLGKGTIGTSYKAILEMGMVVVVKRLKDTNMPEKEFREKITLIGSMDHPNLVTLQAYYYSKDEKLLVFDLVPNGSLSAALHGNKGATRTSLDWETRMNIALGAARGIEYIHLKGNAFSHGRIKSSNVLLSKSNEALVSDGGLCTIGSIVTPGRAAGYRAPEVTDIRKISHKADVYSFGVLLLEMLTGKAPAQAVNNDEGVDLPRWVQSVVREEWNAEVFDQELLNNQNVEESMVQLLQLAIDCVTQYPEKRPSMSEVVRQIEEIRRSSYREEQKQESSSMDVPPINDF